MRYTDLMNRISDVSFYNSTASTWTLATPRATWECLIRINTCCRGDFTDVLDEATTLIVQYSECNESGLCKQLCSGASDELLHRFKLSAGVRSFAYLSASNEYELKGVDEGEEFAKTIAAMKTVGLDDAQRVAVLQIVAAILHLGNVEFGASEDLAPPLRLPGMEAGPKNAHSQEALCTAAELLQVGYPWLFLISVPCALNILCMKLRNHVMSRIHKLQYAQQPSSCRFYSPAYSWLSCHVT